jgi:methyl-accepting chemotaxis protein
MRRYCDCIREILDTINKVSGLAVNINEASKEQASSIMIINQGIEQVSEVVQKIRQWRNKRCDERKTVIARPAFG